MHFNGINTIPYQNNTSNTISSPYYNNITWTTVNNISSSLFISQVLDKMPKILKVDKYKVLSDNRVRIYFSKVSHKAKLDFLPYTATLYFGSDLYGIYNKGDYHYWADSVIVEFKDEYAKILDKSPIFTTFNNFDFEITNEEVIEFIEDLDEYSDYAHCLLERMLTDGNQVKDRSEKIFYHKELDKQLF